MESKNGGLIMGAGEDPVDLVQMLNDPTCEFLLLSYQEFKGDDGRTLKKVRAYIKTTQGGQKLQDVIIGHGIKLGKLNDMIKLSATMVNIGNSSYHQLNKISRESAQNN